MVSPMRYFVFRVKPHDQRWHQGKPKILLLSMTRRIDGIARPQTVVFHRTRFFAEGALITARKAAVVFPTFPQPVLPTTKCVPLDLSARQIVIADRIVLSKR
jgi:hypothetical protein